MWEPERTPPLSAPGNHARKRAAQWERWQQDIIPNLIPHYLDVLYETRSLRHLDRLVPRPMACSCPSQRQKIAVVRFSVIEDIEIDICACQPAAVQLMRAGAFGCAPIRPSLAVDLRVLEFARNLFLEVSPNYTAFSTTLERVLQGMGFQLEHQNSLRKRFSSCLQWYSHMKNKIKERYQRLIDAARPAPNPVATILNPMSHDSIRNASPVRPSAPLTPERSLSRVDPPRGRRTYRTGTRHPHDTLSESPTPADRWGERPQDTPPRSRDSSRSLSVPRGRGHRTSPIARSKRSRAPTPESDPPFPAPLARARPSEYLRRRCPLCFGNLRHDGTLLADVIVSLDACFTQKKNKSPADPPKKHPQTHFVPEMQAARTEDYVEHVRARQHAGKKRKTTTGRPVRVDCDDDGYEHPELLLPRSVLDGCEASFKAADEKRAKASTDFFQDTGLMALLCRHDRVLWVVNMHSAGEKQFYVITLVETLYQHLQLDISVGLLYDIACALERACRKWGFLSHYMHRLHFAVSVFHAFGHEWACQLLYHPRKRSGFGYTDGEGCERFWHSISHLIAHLRISGYHNRLYTLDSQIEHADEGSLLRMGQWIRRRHFQSARKRREAEKALAECGENVQVLREQWLLQVEAQTKPLPRRNKTRGQQAVNAVILLRAAIKTRQEHVKTLRNTFLEAVDGGDPDAVMHQVALEAAEEALASAEKLLRDKEKALGVQEHQALHKLVKSTYIRLRMNARALKRRLRDRLRARKFELDKVERSFRRLINDQKLHAHTEAAVKRREPTISKLNIQYNKLCKDITTLIKQKKAPAGSIAPRPIPADRLWQVDVDDEIWQDVGLDDDTGDTDPPRWLYDEKIRLGIRAMLELDRCKEEDHRLRTERCAMQEWFAEEWQAVNSAMEQAESAADKYQFKLLRDKLVELCATWDNALPNLGVDMASLPPWGPTPEQLSRCVVNAHRVARGEDRHYGTAEDMSDEDGDDNGIGETGCEEDFGLLEALELADNYRGEIDGLL
ncbi:hypothetical protein GGX14DRAFT_368993 [Mycena pura]|uniref:CxC2-like cysteine cluster KDZ transposase-associated domain-containing protein n=1 Tax=Mycena pura TaxID=153505 RepID=A0AAD6V6E0_9AGAR|nr:hypothetical protein GGX14DRAFT_368993 [Mycena pura]